MLGVAMRLRIKVNSSAQSDSVRELADGSLQIRTRAPASKGKANKRVLELLGKYFDTPPGNLEIISGHSSPVKHITVRRCDG